MEKLLTNAESYYDKLSLIYDMVTEPFGAWRAPEEAARAMRYAIEKGSCLIIGVGTGKDVGAVLEQGFVDITGVDISAGMLKVCNNKYKKVKTLKGEVNNVAASCVFDLILCSGVAEYVKDFSGLLMEMRKRLNANGVIVMTFEPILKTEGGKSKEVSIAESLDKDFELVTYRRREVDVMKLISDNALIVIEKSNYVAYVRGGEDVVYTLLVLKHKDAHCAIDYEV